MTDTTEVPFEEAFERLEKILEEMNSQSISLDNSLKLYKEADSLIINCNRRLNEAETKVETLIRNRDGELALNQSGRPQTEPLTPAPQPTTTHTH